MRNCHSMFREDVILKCDRLLQNDPFFNSGPKKEAINFMCKGSYAGIRSYFACEKKVSLQTGK